MIQICTASYAIMYSADSSASEAYDIRCLIVCAMVSMAPLLAGILALLDRNKW